LKNMGDESDPLRNDSADREADERLVHALLLQLHDPQAAEHREERVRRAMLAMREDAKPLSHAEASDHGARILRFPPWARRTAWAAAAVLFIAVGLFVLTYSSSPALASLNDILGALSRPGDQTFRISVEPPDPQNQSPVGLDKSTLYLRNGKLYLLERADPKGGLQFDGYDGQQSWRISGGALAETKEGLGAGGLGMPQTMSEALFSDLQPTLERIRTDYTIERFDLAPLPTGGPSLRHLVARRNSRDVKGAVVIEIWANSKTGMPRRIVFDQAKFQGRPEPRRLMFDLIGENSLPADWFSYQVHVAIGKDNLSRMPTSRPE
jgi:hypothetical protein